MPQDATGPHTDVTDTLTADTWSQYYKELSKDQNTDLRQTDGIPVFQFNSFDGSFQQEANAAAAQMSDAAISMLDLRSNVGGDEKSEMICYAVPVTAQPWSYRLCFPKKTKMEIGTVDS